jgi:succinoglycan biosynthesis protein ExoL
VLFRQLWSAFDRYIGSATSSFALAGMEIGARSAVIGSPSGVSRDRLSPAQRVRNVTELSSGGPPMKLLYVVDDLSEPAVARRVLMLRAGGMDVTLLGFNRAPEPVRELEGVIAHQLVHTRKGNLIGRVGTVLRMVATMGRWRHLYADADVIMARQPVMLLLANLARSRYAPRVPLVFECLDIHRLMVGSGAVGTVLRYIERKLLGTCNLLVVSSPAFVSGYFAKKHPALPPTCLLENKVVHKELEPIQLAAARDQPALPSPSGGPWRIGWYGVIRCRRSLDLLAELARRHPGRVEVIIRGRVAQNLMPVFATVVNRAPGLVYLGPYDQSRDLPRLYGAVHFTWVMDFHEAGGNSDWLLPNPLYEGGVFQSVPLAYAPVETGRWLARQQAGVLFEEPVAEGLKTFFDRLDHDVYMAAKQAMRRLPRQTFVYEAAECNAFASRLAELACA